MLEIRELGVRYGRREVLHTISCTAAPGDLVLLTGPNGAGKSTFLRVIAGEVPSTGAIRGKLSTAFCPDHSFAFPELSTPENIELLMLANEWDAQTRNERRELIVRLVLGDREPWKPVRELSTGLRRRLDIVLTICKPAEICLFDEPLQGLDAEWTETFVDIVKYLAARERICIVASHAVDALLPHASVLWELSNGSMNRIAERSNGQALIPARSYRFDRPDIAGILSWF